MHDPPAALSVRQDEIPKDLASLRQWVCWEYQRKGARWKKRPLNPFTLTPASVADAATWGTAEGALGRLGRPGVAGVGFVLVPKDGLVAVDLDHCRDPATGELTPEARAIVASLGSYAELSPSGAGVHVWVRGRLPEGDRRRDGVELYDRGHYLTVTGHRLAGAPAAIAERSAALAGLHAAVFGGAAAAAPPAPAPLAGPAPAPAGRRTSDAEVVRLARRSKGFSRLFDRGDTGGSGFDHSAADLALCSMLAAVTTDRDQIERIFGRSGLARDKWADRPDYRQRTITTALDRSRAPRRPR